MTETERAGREARTDGDASHGQESAGSASPDYRCSRCEWAGDDVNRKDHYPVCPNCGAIVFVLEGSA